MSARSWPKVAAAIEHKGAARVGAIAICVLVAGILWIGNAIAMIVLPLMLWSILEAAMDFFDASVLLRSWVFGLWFCFCGLPPVIGVLSVVRHARVRMVPLYQLMGTACITLGLAILSLAMQMR